jgi:pimeloyl-ACP methyl ester carboxylesterase
MADHINGALHWEQLGKSGRPMVFVHPNPMDHSCWVYQMDHFSTWYRCIGIDLPGYGKSPTATRGLTMLDVTAACWEAVDDAVNEPAILVGLSVGAKVVLRMAATRPQQTLAVILSGTSYTPGPKEFAARQADRYEKEGVAHRYEHALQDWSAGFRETEMGRYFATIFQERNPWADAPTIAEMYRAHGEPDDDWMFEGTKAPTLVITGSEDTSHQAAFAVRDKIADCEIITMVGAGHACNMERPWEWDGYALRFLEQHGLLERGR